MTAQEPEILIYNGRQLDMISNPDINPGNANEWRMPFHTANYRGYVGTWEIKDNKLYLVNVSGGTDVKLPAFADWVTQDLEAWSGNLLHYVHAGYGSMYEENIIFKIEAGVLVDIRIEDNTKKFRELAIKDVQSSKNKINMGFLYGIYLDPKGELSRLIEKSTSRKEEYITLQQELEVEFKKKLVELAKDPESGIVLQYK